MSALPGLTRLRDAAVVAAITLSFSIAVSADELGDLDLPTSGLTEQSLASRDDLMARYVELTQCPSCEVILDGQTVTGSADYVRFAEERVTVTLNGSNVTFESFYTEQADLGGCERYVGGKIADGPSGLSGRWVSESVAFTFSGAEASLVPGADIIELKTNIVWPNNPMSADLPASLFIAGPNTVHLPFAGQDGADLVARINELAGICDALGWP